MENNDLRKYTVKVGNGSGCMFQPMDDKHTYILTAKHLFQTNEAKAKDRNLLENGFEISITFQKYNDGFWSENSDIFILNIGVNFFPHPNQLVDAAILKIPYKEDYNRIESQLKNNTTLKYFLCGFPERLATGNDPGEQSALYPIKYFLGSGSFFEIAKLDDGLSKEDVKGCSGGGLLCLNKIGNICIIGIQSRMANMAVDNLGEIGYIPMSAYEEIIDEYSKNKLLDKLLPGFLKSFGALVGNIFEMNSGPLEMEKENHLSTTLISKAVEISKSDLTPIAIRDFIDEKMLIMVDQDSSNLKSKKIWSLWFELLVILNIIKNKSHQFEDLTSLFEEFRFFYSDINSDFLGYHLRDLHKAEFAGLKNGGIVFVASNVKAQGELKGIIKLNKIPVDIKKYRDEHIRNQALLGVNINDASTFPYDRFRFANISTFKEEMLSILDEDFYSLTTQECLNILYIEYGKLIDK
jgi:hypothetical protein